MSNTTMPPALAGQVDRHVGPLARMSVSEEAWMMRNPHALRLLMDYQDQAFSEAESCGEPGECGRWPTARWTALYERGRSIMAEDLELWDADLLRAFGFPERPNARGEAPGTERADRD
jgi:hypothetical protein